MKSKNKVLKSSVMLFISVACFACSTNIAQLNPSDKNSNIVSNVGNHILTGRVKFPDKLEAKYKTKATIGEIAISATVSLIYPSDFPDTSKRNITISTALTDNNGGFTINTTGNFVPKIGDIFILEAIKRIGGPGNNVISLRTNVKFNGSTYDSITTPSIFLNTYTTALSVISSLNPTTISSNETIGKISVVNNISTTQNINANVTASLINSVAEQVRQALERNIDPVQDLYFVNNNYYLKSSSISTSACIGDCSNVSNGLVSVNKISKSSVYSGDTIEITGAGFSSDITGNIVTLTLPETKITGTIIESSSTRLLVKFEGNISSDSSVGKIQVQVATNLSNTFNLTFNSALNYKLLFVSEKDGNKEIYNINEDGTNLKRLTFNNSEDYNPVWSPDGRYIAFVSKRDNIKDEKNELTGEIYVMNSDGSNQRRLTFNTSHDSQPVWDPNITSQYIEDYRIAFISNRYGEYITQNNQTVLRKRFVPFLMNADGSNQTYLELTFGNTNTYGYHSLQWKKEVPNMLFAFHFEDNTGLNITNSKIDSPDTFSLINTGIRAFNINLESSSLPFISLDGSNPRAVNFSVSKSYIYYTENTSQGSIIIKSAINVSGAITNFSAPSFTNNPFSKGVDFSPASFTNKYNSTKLAYTTVNDSITNISNLNIALDTIESGLSNITYRVVSNVNANQTLSWSPDGTKIAFISDRDGKTKIYTVREEGSDERLIAEGYFQSWSPEKMYK